MTNRVHEEGDQVSLPVPEGALAGEPVKVGGLVGVLLSDRAKTDVAAVGSDGLPNPAYNAGGGNPHGMASVATQGTFALKVPQAVGAVGDPIYITPARALSTTASGNAHFGHAMTTKAADSGGVEGRVHVKLLRV